MPARDADRHDYPVIWSVRYTIAYDFNIWSSRYDPVYDFFICSCRYLSIERLAVDDFSASLACMEMIQTAGRIAAIQGILCS